jgi:hypothetical protein
MWVLCLYFMGLNLSNVQISKELGLDASDVQMVTTRLREGLTVKGPEIKLNDLVEADEVYVVAGHKGNPEAVKKGTASAAKKTQGRARAWPARKRKAADPRTCPTQW